MVIYADELFVKNFIMSYLILVIVGELLNLKYRKKDAAIGSLISSLISLISIIYDIDNNVLTRGITLSLMTLLSFKPKETKTFIIEISFILGITFLIGGVMNSNIKNLFEIIVSGVISILAFKKYGDYYKQKKWKTRNQYKLNFKLENNDIEIKAFLDTGNFLTSNIKEEPVIVISKEALRNKIPNKILDLLAYGEISDLNFDILKNIRTINYLVLNEESRLSYGLKVKNIKVEGENCSKICDAVIVLSENKIKESDAIIGINLLEGGLDNGNTVNVETKSKEIIC